MPMVREHAARNERLCEYQQQPRAAALPSLWGLDVSRVSHIYEPNGDGRDGAAMTRYICHNCDADEGCEFDDHEPFKIPLDEFYLGCPHGCMNGPEWRYAA